MGLMLFFLPTVYLDLHTLKGRRAGKKLFQTKSFATRNYLQLFMIY